MTEGNICYQCGEEVELDSKIVILEMHKGETRRMQFCKVACLVNFFNREEDYDDDEFGN